MRGRGAVGCHSKVDFLFCCFQNLEATKTYANFQSALVAMGMLALIKYLGGALIKTMSIVTGTYGMKGSKLICFIAVL